MTIRRTTVWILIGLAALLVIGCAGAVTAKPEAATNPPEATITASPPSETEAAPTEAPTAIIPATSPPLGADAPLELSGFEMIALDTGLATYSGYECLYTPAGCACEVPELIQSQFDYDEEADSIAMTVVGEGYQFRWNLTHNGVNKWTYSLPMYNNQDQIGEARVLISFDDEGYVMTYLFDDYASGIVTCPDVNFSRVPGG
jgi:hypothetical protein